MTAVLLLDMMKDIGMSNTEIQKYIEAWIFNGLFILSRSIGFIWHFIDQKLLNEPLYRSDWDDILYI
jgi:ATP-citrate lyase alpha-subunit